MHPVHLKEKSRGDIANTSEGVDRIFDENCFGGFLGGFDNGFLGASFSFHNLRILYFWMSSEEGVFVLDLSYSVWENIVSVLIGYCLDARTLNLVTVQTRVELGDGQSPTLFEKMEEGGML